MNFFPAYAEHLLDILSKINSEPLKNAAAANFPSLCPLLPLEEN